MNQSFRRRFKIIYINLIEIINSGLDKLRFTEPSLFPEELLNENIYIT